MWVSLLFLGWVLEQPLMKKTQHFVTVFCLCRSTERFIICLPGPRIPLEPSGNVCVCVPTCVCVCARVDNIRAPEAHRLLCPTFWTTCPFIGRAAFLFLFFIAPLNNSTCVFVCRLGKLVFSFCHSFRILKKNNTVQTKKVNVKLKNIVIFHLGRNVSFLQLILVCFCCRCLRCCSEVST